MQHSLFRKIRFSRSLALLALALTACSIVWVISVYLPPAVDWQTTHRPAALKLISGRSPYEIDSFLNPIWTLIPLLPIALFPEKISRGVLFVVTLAAFIYTARKMGIHRSGVLLILLSPPAMHELLNGNIDWLAILGFVFPPRLGLFFLAIKPQVGMAVAVFWVIEAWRDGGWRKVIWLIWPVSIALLLSFLIFGFWPGYSAKTLTYWWNASLWPASIPAGLALLVTAIRKRDLRFSIGASPCLSPYLLLHSWIGVLFAIGNRTPELLAAVIGLWTMVILRAIG